MPSEKKASVKRIFVCSPLRGVVTPGGTAEHPADVRSKNFTLAKKLCIAVVNVGHAPYAPHVFFPAIGLDDGNPVHRSAGIAAGTAWLGMADEIWVFAEDYDGCSEGMRAEIDCSERFNIPPKLVFMPPCWEQLRSYLPPPRQKPVAEPPPLRGANTPVSGCCKEDRMARKSASDV